MDGTRHHYRAYGLRISSELPLAPFLHEGAPGHDGAQVRIDLGVPRGERRATDVEFEPDGAVRVLVRDGRQAFLDPRKELTPAALAEYAAGVVLAVVLAQRGAFVLHASAVRAGDSIIAFTGRSGAGKSTTASVFAESGCPVVTDDFLPLEIGAHAITCVGGPGALKLLEHGRARVAGHFAVGAGLGEKCLVFPPTGLHNECATALGAIYAVEDGAEFGVEVLTGQRAIATLLRDAFCLAVTGKRRRLELLDRCAAIASRVGVRVLRRPRDIERAGAMVEVVMRDLVAQDGRAG